MVDSKIDKVLAVLSTGGTLYQQLVSGAFLLCSKNGGRVSDVEINVTIFIALKERKLIKYVSTMRQGHSFFRGKVLVYRIAEEE